MLPPNHPVSLVLSFSLSLLTTASCLPLLHPPSQLKTCFANSLRKNGAVRRKLAQISSVPPAHVVACVPMYSSVLYVTIDELSVILSKVR